MARPKIPRKSTTVDMTAMCDVAFLLLSFFILATKFKPSEAVTINTPNSVSSKFAPEKDIVMFSMNKDGHVFLSMDDKTKMEGVVNAVNQANNIGLSSAEVNALAQQPVIGTPFSQLSQQAKIPASEISDKTLPGIPSDSANNQIVNWMNAVVSVYTGEKLNLLLKGDNMAKYPAFKSILDAFKKTDQLKFQMVTNPEAVPTGTELWNANITHQNVEE